jgi:hypothetical protein
MHALFSDCPPVHLPHCARRTWSLRFQQVKGITTTRDGKLVNVSLGSTPRAAHSAFAIMTLCLASLIVTHRHPRNSQASTTLTPTFTADANHLILSCITSTPI